MTWLSVKLPVQPSVVTVESELGKIWARVLPHASEPDAAGSSALTPSPTRTPLVSRDADACACAGLCLNDRSSACCRATCRVSCLVATRDSRSSNIDYL